VVLIVAALVGGAVLLGHGKFELDGGGFGSP
jgi:hypothetical protein